MSRTTNLLASLVLAPALLAAQDRGAFVTTLGRDTMALERFAWNGNVLHGEVVQVSPAVNRATYTVTMGANGAPADYLLDVRNINDTNPATQIHIAFGADSIRFTRTVGSKVTYSAAPAESAVYPENLYFWELYELQARAMVRATGDSIPFRMVSAGGPKPYTVNFRRRASDTLSTKFFYPEYWMNYIIDKSGKLLVVDGSHTTIKVLARRQADVPLETFLTAAAAREKSAGALGAMSRSDSINTTVGTAAASIAYSRPAARGRQVWGGVVPYGIVWRTGANSATLMHLSTAVEIGGTLVPAGDYTLFSLPTAAGSQLIINKQVGQWGTEYHEERDLARVPVRTQKLGAKTELFTIRFEPTGAGAQDLVIEWDDIRWTVSMRAPKG